MSLWIWESLGAGDDPTQPLAASRVQDDEEALSVLQSLDLRDAHSGTVEGEDVVPFKFDAHALPHR